MVKSNRFSKSRKNIRKNFFLKKRERSLSIDSNGSTGSCLNKSHIAKYRNRPSPPFPANSCCNQVMPGNNGLMYKSVPDKNGVCKWKKIT